MKSLLLTLVLPAALALASCSTAEKYYRLSADGPPPPTGAGFALGVGPVSLPDYIDRAELVFQSSDERFEVPFERRWAGSLRDTTTRAIGTNLARRLGTGNLLVYPWPPGTLLDYQVRVSVRQFHGRSGGDAILEASWTVEDGRTGRVLVRRGGNYVEPVVFDGYEGIVAAENRLLSQFSKDIAESFPRR
jgi:uncharacterized lipoprotein YmbA